MCFSVKSKLKRVTFSDCFKKHMKVTTTLIKNGGSQEYIDFSFHYHLDCLLKSSFRPKEKQPKIQSSALLIRCARNPSVSSHKGPVMRKVYLSWNYHVVLVSTYRLLSILEEGKFWSLFRKLQFDPIVLDRNYGNIHTLVLRSSFGSNHRRLETFV